MMTYDFLKGLSSHIEAFARQPNEQLMDHMEKMMFGLTPEHVKGKANWACGRMLWNQGICW